MNIYNNQFYEYLLRKETEGIKRELELKGATIVDEERHLKYITGIAKFNFWILLLVFGWTVFLIGKWTFNMVN